MLCAVLAALPWRFGWTLDGTLTQCRTLALDTAAMARAPLRLFDRMGESRAYNSGAVPTKLAFQNVNSLYRVHSTERG